MAIIEVWRPTCFVCGIFGGKLSVSDHHEIHFPHSIIFSI